MQGFWRSLPYLYKQSDLDIFRKESDDVGFIFLGVMDKTKSITVQKWIYGYYFDFLEFFRMGHKRSMQIYGSDYKLKKQINVSNMSNDGQCLVLAVMVPAFLLPSDTSPSSIIPLSVMKSLVIHH